MTKFGTVCFAAFAAFGLTAAAIAASAQSGAPVVITPGQTPPRAPTPPKPPQAAPRPATTPAPIVRPTTPPRPVVQTPPRAATPSTPVAAQPRPQPVVTPPRPPQPAAPVIRANLRQAPQEAGCGAAPSPVRPAVPGGAMSGGQISDYRTQTTSYLRNADKYRSCLNGYLTAERDKMFRTNGEETPQMKAASYAHSDVSAQKADVYETYISTCIDYVVNRAPNTSVAEFCTMQANPN